jgi:hypothetical protein
MREMPKRAFLATKMHHRLGNRHLEGRLDRARQQMPTTERAVLQAKYRMEMKARLAVIAARG